MPGILPMKVIKVGTSAQTRIAQACDRCRSKKIRCDGLRPCTQCSNVGFECKTSDKLSRRAFPRGYTESLEERVRTLETEARELKDLLDEKDEKIDLLSKIYDRSPQRKESSRRGSLAATTPESNQGIQMAEEQSSLETFKIQQPQCLLPGEQADSVYMGRASGRAFADAFKVKLQESGKQCSELNVDALFSAIPKLKHQTIPSTISERRTWRPPPQILSDMLIQVYFQEWAPLFPVVHRPTVLSLYEKYVSNPEAIQDKHSLAQLYLIFSIAALSHESRLDSENQAYERVWSAALKEFIGEKSMVNVQSLILAQIYSIQKADAGKLLYYKGIAIATAQRLGLHLSQKRFALGALTSESRKKVFWTLYTLDCFSAAYLGLPRSFHDDDIHCEYPADVDDEYVTENGFQPTLPGEFTRLSSALALFRLSRVLSKVLDRNYQSGPSQEFSFQGIASLADDLEAWSASLAPHLKLDFSKDKPSPQVISSRCPLLSMTYHYIRTLIHRPAVCANLGQRASSSVLAMATSSKHIIQIIQLLEERTLSFTQCLNKNELLLVSGFGVLFQALDLDADAKLMRDNQKSIWMVMDLLSCRAAPAASEFFRFACTAIAVNPKYRLRETVATAKGAKSDNQSCNNDKHEPSVMDDLAARYALAAGLQARPRMRTNSHTDSSKQNPSKQPSNKFKQAHHKHSSGGSISPSTVPKRADSESSSLEERSQEQVEQLSRPSTMVPNLDYFQFPIDVPVHAELTEDDSPHTDATTQDSQDPTIWEQLLNSLDENQIGPTDEFYHCSVTGALHSPLSLVASSTSTASSATSSTFNSNDMGWKIDRRLNVYTPTMQTPHNSALSMLDFPDEGLTSSEDFCAGKPRRSIDHEAFAEMMISTFSPPEVLTPDQSDDFELLNREA